MVETGFGAGQLVNDLTYGKFAGYLQVASEDYVLSLTNADGKNTLISYLAPLKTLNLQGYSIVAAASGFLTPENPGDPSFGIWVALPTGGNLISLPVYSEETDSRGTARVQVIHNSADAAASVVDVWLNNTLLLDNFAFRTSSPFVDAPAGMPFTISVAGPYSQSPKDAIWSKSYTLKQGSTYVLIANGNVSTTFSESDRNFDIYVYDRARETAMVDGKTDILVFHGATDAPTVDVVETGFGAGQLVNDLTYGKFAGYLQVASEDYVLSLTNADGKNTLISYLAPLKTLNLQGYSIVAAASGFLTPENPGDPSFGIWVALPSGGDMISLPVHSEQTDSRGTARVQVIHNSADAAASVVDVWLNNTLLLDNFAFRTSSPFVDAPAGVEFTIAIKDQNSTGPENPIWSKNYTLADGGKYILVANGIVSLSGYDPIQPFDIYVYDMAREEATNGSNTDVLVFHGSTDAPVVDVVEVFAGAGTIINDLNYGQFAGYLELPTANYQLDIRNESGEVTVATYNAQLADLGLQGMALAVMASGFLNPGNNSNGDAFGLFVALPTGGDLIELGLTSSVDEIVNVTALTIYPNPVSSVMTLNLELRQDNEIQVELFNLLGSKMTSETLNPGMGYYQHKMNVANLPEGMYIMVVNAGDDAVTRKFQIVR